MGTPRYARRTRVTGLQKTVALCLAFVAVVVGMFVYRVTGEHVPSIDRLRELGVFILPEARALEPFELETHTGAAFRPQDLAGAWSFVFFGFTNCPDVCPTSLSVMAQAERRLLEADSEAFAGVLVSVDPERDGREELAAYVGAFSENFVGLRGELIELARFAQSVHVLFAKVPDDGSEGGFNVDHSGNIVLIDPRGQYYGFIRMPHKVDTLLAAFRYLRAAS